jgi:hypothetical protein
LRGGLQESGTLRKEGSLTLSLPEDDIAALSLIIIVINARNDLLPTTYNLQILTGLAIVVDKYNFHASVIPWAKIWTASLESQLSSSSSTCEEIICWIALSWVFKLPKVFSEATAIACRTMAGSALYGSSQIQRLKEQLPIPEAVDSKCDFAYDYQEAC